MNGLDADHDRIAAEYVLGLLEPEELRRAEALLDRDEAFRAGIEAWRTHFASLDATAQPLATGDALWSRIEAGLVADATPETIPAARLTPLVVPDVRTSLRALWANLSFWRLAGLTGAAASLALAVGLGLIGSRPAPPILVAVLVTEANRPAAIVNAFADGHAELVSLEQIAVPPGRALQIWTLWDRARGPVSLGLLNQARTVQLGIRDIPRPGPNQLFEITLEPEAGSPTGRPTGRILFIGRARGAETQAL